MTEDIESIEIELLLEAIYRKYDYDFRGYSRASIRRRLRHARELLHCSSISAMQERVLRDPTFLTNLMPYLTVQVSELFRDPQFYSGMRANVIPVLKTYPSLRVWIAGCATGEELYSLAILFREEGLENRTLFYATDINTAALKVAEQGIYSIDRIQHFTRNYQRAGGRASLSEYYTAGYGRVVFDRSLIQRTVFSDHSLVSDSTFAEVQLITCRNVLIYFDRPLQDRALELFTDSLSRKGFLGLGSKENLRFSSHAGLYEEFDYPNRIYRRKD